MGIHFASIRSTVVLGLIFCSGSSLGGCSSAPVGDDGGRMSVYSTRESEKEDRGANLAALTEHSDDAVELIASELNKLPASDPNESEKWIIAIGSLENRTNNTPTSDFELFQHRVRGGLVSSPLLRRHFVVVENRERMQNVMDRSTGGGVDRLQDGHSGPAVNAYDPSRTYVLNGSFFEADRSGKAQYYLSYELVNLQSGEIALNATKDLGQKVGKH